MYTEKAKPYSDGKNWSNTYLTDPRLLELLGPFDTDPCVHTEMPWKTATTMYDINTDGLKQEWVGRVWMNPPYRDNMVFAEKFIQAEWGICLLNGKSTETRSTQLIMKNSACIWFPLGRLSFYRPNGEEIKVKFFNNILIGLTDEDRNSFVKAKEVYGGEIFVH